MDFKKSEYILILFIIFIISSYVELTFGGFGGSIYLAFIFFLISLYLLTKLKNEENIKLKGSKKVLFVGIGIIIADVLYNFKIGSDIQTLDTVVILFGISLIAISQKNSSIRYIGEFGTYFSSIFLFFFLILYAIPSKLGSNIYEYYGYYATTISSVYILRALGLSLEIDSLTTFHAYGVEDIYYKIDLGCFGFYSIMLIVSTVLAYRITSPPKKPDSPNLIKITGILIIASFIANLLRIILLVYIGYYYGSNTMELFHTFLGWALFTSIVLPVSYIYLK